MARNTFTYRRAGSLKVARVLVIWGSLAAGVVATVLTNNLINEAKESAVVEAPAPVIETAKVLVAAIDIKVGQNLNAEALKWQEWPRDLVGESFITESGRPDAMGELDGRIVRTPFAAGEPLTPTKLHEQKTGGIMSAGLPSGMRAFSVKISPETGAGGFILPDDRVDVLLTRKQQSSDPSEKVAYTSETVLRNVQVLAIDQSVKDQGKGDGEGLVAIGKTATLALTPAQAETVALSDAQGDISLTLRSMADVGEAADDGARDTLAMRVHRAGEGGMTVTRFTVAPASQDRLDRTKVALH
jgi:pilus assembly protein CpaB